MKKLLFKTLFVASLFISTNTLNAQCTLDQVGAVNYALYSTYSDMAIAPNGLVYTISYNTNNTKFELYAGQTAATWTLVATFASSTTVKPDIAVHSSGKVSVLLRDDIAGKVAKLYYLSGGTLIQQGAAISTSTVSNLSLDFDAAGNEYVAYTDVANSNFATVKKWASGSSTWVPVGSGIASPGPGFYNSILIDNTNTPVLAFQDATTAPANRISVVKFNGSVWSAPTVVSTNPGTNAKLKLASNGNYFLGYTENTSSAVVQKFNGSTWAALGSPVSGLSFVANSFDLELDAIDVPYFIAYQNTSFYTVSYKYTGVPTWSNTIGAGTISSSTTNNVSISIASNGTPFFFYVDQSANNALNVKTLTSPLSISSQPFSITRCNLQSGSFNVGVVGGVPLGYQWQVGSAGTFTNAGVPYLNGTTNTLSFTASTAMNQNKVRSIVNAGCKNIITNTATLTVISPSLSIIPTNPSCFGACNGFVTSLPTGGTGPYIYNWSNGAVTPSITGVCAGTYSLTTTDASGCTVTATANLINPPPISSSFTGNQTICNGANTSLTVTAINGVPAYTYSWSPAAGLSSTTSSVVTANPPSTQTYNVQITDANGCVATNTVMITVNAAPTVSAGSDMTICSGGIATLFASGTANTYTWNPGNMVGAIQNVSPLSATNYTVVGTNTVTGCTTSDVMTVFVNALPVANAGPTRTLTCANTSTTLSGSGGSTYNWTGPGILAGGTTATPTINLPGTYSLTVTSAGCTSTVSTVFVSQNTVAPSPSAANSGPITCSSPTVSLSGTPGAGVTYLWSGPGITGSTTTQNTTANQAGNYTLQVISSINGCTNNAITTVSQNTTPPTASASSSGTLTCATTTLGLTGTGGGTYNWTGPGIASGGTTPSPVITAPGCYTLVVTSAVNGCTASAVTCATQNTTAPATSTNVSGVLNCTITSVNASATTTVSPVTYNWSGGGITSATNISTITVNAGGVKNYTVTNTSNGCVTTGSLNVSQNLLAPTATASVTGTVTCLTSTVQLSGGPAAGVTYTWSAPGGSSISSGVNSQNAIGNGAGTYTLFVTMISSGCSNSKTVTATQNTAIPFVVPNVTNSITCTNVTASAIASTTASPVSYNWSGTGIISGGSTGTITTNTSGVKNYTVTNTSNGCYTTGTVSVSQNTASPVGLSAGSNQTLTCVSPSVTLSGSIISPTNASVSWTGGVCGNATTLISGACSPGVYTLTATDITNGCNASSTVAIYADASVPTVTLSPPSGSLTCVTTTVNITANANPSTVMFSWTPTSGIIPGTETTSTPTFTAAGNYSVVITNTINGCSSMASTSVIQNTTSPSINITASSSVICSGNSSTLTASGAVTYAWSSGPTTAAIVAFPIGTTSYTVTGTGSNGCTDIATQVITVNSAPVLSVTGNTMICKGSTSDLTATGAPSYTWSTGANTSSISVTPSTSTTYTLIGENGNGCQAFLLTTVSIIPSKNLSGTITSTAGATTGDVILYKYVSSLSQWDSVTTVPFTTFYSFSALDSALYVVRAIPTATNIQVTYGDNAISWQDATIINHGCANNTTQDIDLIALENFIAGPGVLTGVITEGNGFGQKTNDAFKPLVPGTPIGGIVVKGGKNPGGQMFVQTTTDAAGQYTLTGLPLNSGTESYFIFVDIPGLDTNGTYHIVVSSGNTQFTNLNFYVDSMYINPNSVTSVNQENLIAENKIIVFPNPAKQFVSVQYELLQSANVNIELFDVVGRKLYTIEDSRQEKNKYSHKINTEPFSSGVYLVKLKINNSESTIKLILTE